MIKRILLRLFGLILLAQSFSAYAQQEDIFPQLTGQALRDSLVMEFKPQNIYGYDRARDSLFGSIFLYDGYVSCIYTGDSITINPDSAVAPRTQANSQGFNTEHTFPQSKGAGSGNARSDIHHLFPCRADANSSRSNLPFADVPDSLVDTWWRHNYSQTTIPDTLREEYSRRASFGFEVRDKMKGDAARVTFYFYTMYQNESQNADPDFFPIQLQTLKRWHIFDRPDQNEYNRNLTIASHQEGKINPFIADTTLVKRAFGIAPPVSFDIDIIDETQLQLNWEKNANNDKVLIIRNQSGVFNGLVDGQTYTQGFNQELNGYVIVTDADSIIDNLPHLGTYYYSIYSVTDTLTYSINLLRFKTSGFSDALHYWNFNHNVPEPLEQWADTLQASSGSGILIHFFTDIQSFQGTILNTLDNDLAGGSFSPRGTNNNNKHLMLHVPTTAHENIFFSYATRGTLTGYDTQSIFYSTDGTNFDSLTSFFASNFDWVVRTVDFSSKTAVNDNPDFKIKIYVDGATGHSGNNRFDNFQITGNEVVGLTDNKAVNTHVAIYPNPFKDFVNIKVQKSEEIFPTINIFNKSGQLVFSKNLCSELSHVDLSWLSKGLYIVQIYDKDFFYNGKLVKL